MNNKRFIEQSFPVKEVSVESAREKNIRHGHISTLHIWWARRPLASSRATAYAALIPAPENDVEWDKRRQFIIDLSKWENSLNPTIIEKARKDILGIRDQESGISEELFPNSQSQMPNPLLNGQWMVTDSQTPMPDAQSLLANFDPAKGTVKGAVARCLVCGSTVDANTTRKLFQEGKASQRMIATVLHHPKKKGKTYRVATGKDLEVFREVEKYLEEKRTKLKEEWGIDPVPDEGLVRTGGNQIAVLHYGMYKFGDLFNTRQKLALIIFVEKVREAYKKMIENGCDEEYAKAVVTYLGLGIDRLSTHLCSLVRWRSDAISFERVFDRQALSMIWDYGEVNPFSDSRGHWDLEPMLETIKHVSSNSTPATITQSSATSLPYPDNFFDAIFTDPPYYDNVYYSNLSDFFYVWLKRTVGDLYPDLFSTPLTPKSKEIVADSIRHAEKSDAKAFFEENLKKAFQETHRVLKPNGIATIVYTHRSTSGWETLINSLLDSGLVITASWPIHTEMRGKLNA
ncbi:MAG: DUF1156 domain-containing protein [Methanophagales archaeon]|nr:DUF1156 domain-containing protein [Methanophagales archaeon]